MGGTDLGCATDNCSAEPVVHVWRADLGDRPVAACRAHAVAALRNPATRIVAAYQPDVALSVYAEAQAG
jgi:hypothetical protein